MTSVEHGKRPPPQTHAAPGDSRTSVWIRCAIIGAAITVITLLHYVTPTSLVHWHYVCQRLYYLPVVYAALSFGWRGGLAAAALAGFSYLPSITTLRLGLPSFALNQYLEIIVFCLVGILTGVVVDREKKQKRASQDAAERLSRVYGELQDNFERMKRAEKLYAIGQLSAGLAHEIRNPLASIAGAAGILKRGAGSGRKHAECIDIIERESSRLNRLLSNFLDFARPRTPHFQVISLEPVFESVMDLAAHAVDRRPITLRKEVDPALPPLESDPEQLKQVLLNLVINAVQAMDEGGEIVMSAIRRHSAVLIEVTDQGRALDAEHMDRIFDPFFTTKEHGTGLGLSVAHQIVTQLGGALTARRNPERGMTFSVLLPFRPEGRL